MARYRLLQDGEEIGVEKNTRAEVEQWVEDNVRACGLDWRVGYQVKLRKSEVVYKWVWSKTGEPLKP